LEKASTLFHAVPVAITGEEEDEDEEDKDEEEFSDEVSGN
jgi:hypothetical protein